MEIILVGDSAAQLMLGSDSMLPATLGFMATTTAAVRRGAPNVYLIADMSFLSYHVSVSEAIRNAGRYLAEAGAQMVKVEATGAFDARGLPPSVSSGPGQRGPRLPWG